MSEGGKFLIQLFDGKINFAIWKSSVEDYLVQQGIDDALLKERPIHIDEAKMDTNTEEGGKHNSACHCTRNQVQLLERDKSR